MAHTYIRFKRVPRYGGALCKQMIYSLQRMNVMTLLYILRIIVRRIRIIL